MERVAGVQADTGGQGEGVVEGDVVSGEADGGRPGWDLAVVEQRGPLLPAQGEVAQVREVGEDGPLGAGEVESVQVGGAAQRREVGRGGGVQVDRRGSRDRRARPVPIPPARS
ncbi:hypothetical protein [Streptomyces sp. NPDC001312]|uniref:hypothetical protein n=1 Tax=Streptomyces sp. NPDC001312 TaxID=3364561 RepID=UPI00369B441B